MQKEEAIARLRRQIDAVEQIQGGNESDGSPGFLKWKRDTAVAIEKIFGLSSKHVKEFETIRYSLQVVTNWTTEEEHHDRYLEGLGHAKAFLESLISELTEYGADAHQPAPALTVIEEIRRLCERFHLVVRQLRSRHDGRPPLDIEDEYDVQDLLHALLHIRFDDIRREEWTPSYAGGASRMDFLLKAEQTVIETKRSRKGLDAKRLGEELIVDIQRYQSHQDCKRLVCFVYDPDGRISNPRGIERDLSGSRSEIEVVVVIAPR